jgi:hypothetical protein
MMITVVYFFLNVMFGSPYCRFPLERSDYIGFIEKDKGKRSVPIERFDCRDVMDKDKGNAE